MSHPSSSFSCLHYHLYPCVVSCWLLSCSLHLLSPVLAWTHAAHFYQIHSHLSVKSSLPGPVLSSASRILCLLFVTLEHFPDSSLLSSVFPHCWYFLLFACIFIFPSPLMTRDNTVCFTIFLWNVASSSPFTSSAGFQNAKYILAPTPLQYPFPLLISCNLIPLPPNRSFSHTAWLTAVLQGLPGTVYGFALPVPIGCANASTCLRFVFLPPTAVRGCIPSTQ